MSEHENNSGNPTSENPEELNSNPKTAGPREKRTKTGDSGSLAESGGSGRFPDSGSLSGSLGSTGSGVSTLSGKVKQKPKRDERDLGPLFFLLIICIFLPVGIKFYGSYMEKRTEYLRKTEEEKALTSEIKRLEKKNEEMKSREKYLHTEHGVEEIARNKLGLIKPREIPFIVKPARDTSGRNVVTSDKNKKEKKPDEKKKEEQEKNSDQ
ncbi:MAG: septum formation initiator family protein [Firmicutes bacterium]|nr:septum formation initiator family protein [Bacillota bacterium]